MNAKLRGFASDLVRRKSILWVILAGAARLQSVYADEECRATSEDCVPVGRWNFSVAVGAGVRTNPLANGRDIPLAVIPQFSYYGKRFFVDGLDAGFTLAENAANTFNVIASPGYDRVYFYRRDPQNFFVGFPAGPSAQTVETNTMLGSGRGSSPTPHVTYLAGPEWSFTWNHVSGQLDVLHDLTGQNSGTEIRAALGIPIVASRGSLSADVGLTWKSAAIVNYYYGEAKVYEGGAALDPFLKLGYKLPLAKHWRLEAFAEYERLAGAIADSPIVAQHDVMTAFVGVRYAF